VRKNKPESKSRHPLFVFVTLCDSGEAGSGASGTDWKAQTIRLRFKRQNDISPEIMFK
jgi:hypothetical protein